MRTELKIIKEAAVAQKHCNEILRTQHEMNLFTCKVEGNDKNSCEYLALMRENALFCARVKVGKVRSKISQ